MWIIHNLCRPLSVTNGDCSNIDWTSFTKSVALLPPHLSSSSGAMIHYFKTDVSIKISFSQQGRFSSLFGMALQQRRSFLSFSHWPFFDSIKNAAQVFTDVCSKSPYIHIYFRAKPQKVLTIVFRVVHPYIHVLFRIRISSVADSLI